MTDYLILHKIDPIFFLPQSDPDGQHMVVQNEYDRIAIVTADSLDEVFEKTNHIYEDWTKNDGVSMIVKGARSTSVGDLVLNMDTLDLVICAPIGWKPAVWVG